MQKPKDQHAFIFPNSKHQGLPPADKHATTSYIPLFVLFEKKLFILYVYTCVHDIHTGALRSEKRVSDHRELKFQLVTSSLMWVLGTKLESSERAPNALLTAELSLRPLIYFFEMGSYCAVQASLHRTTAHLSFRSSRLTDTHHAQPAKIELLLTVDKAHLHFCVFCYNSCIKQQWLKITQFASGGTERMQNKKGENENMIWVFRQLQNN